MLVSIIRLMVGTAGAGLCNGFTPIRSLVTSQAFTSSVLNTINQEFVFDNDVVKDIFQSNLHLGTDLLYTAILGYTVYLQYQNNKKN